MRHGIRRICKFIAFILLGIVAICGYSFLTDKTTYTNWDIKKIKPGTSEISWASFVWGNDSISGKYFTKTAMFIPCKIEGLPYSFTFQFDLGADLSGIYENNIRSFFRAYPQLQNRFIRLRSPLQFWNNKKAFKNVSILFGNYRVRNHLGYVYSDYGGENNIDNSTLKDTFQIGTIGADLFKNKVLIIDYPNKRFAIGDTIPNLYKAAFCDIQLDKAGRILLPLSIKGKTYKIMFDNGSSIFPLLVAGDKINNFSTASNTDTLKINSWGKYHKVIGRPLTDSFQLAGQSFSKIKVYADYRSGSNTNANDGITGNALFWNKTIIIDFKKRKFGVQ